MGCGPGVDANGDQPRTLDEKGHNNHSKTVNEGSYIFGDIGSVDDGACGAHYPG